MQYSQCANAIKVSVGVGMLRRTAGGWRLKKEAEGSVFCRPGQKHLLCAATRWLRAVMALYTFGDI